MTETISRSISTKVWDRAGIKLATPGSAVRLTTDYAMGLIRLYTVVSYWLGMRRSRGGTGGPDPPGKSQKYWVFLAILVRIPWKMTKLSSQHSLSGYHRPASKMPFRWWANDGPLLVLYRSSVLPSSTKKKTLSGLDHL